MSKWQPIETAPKDGTIIDVWLNKETMYRGDRQFYCVPGTFRSTNWHWQEGKFRPFNGLNRQITFVEPTHWMPIPEPPK